MLAKKKKKLRIPGVKTLYKLGVKPNHLTITGLLIAVTAFFTPLSTGLILFSTAFFIDVLDGNLARNHKLTSKFGGVLDSTIDKIVEALFITYLGIQLGAQTQGMMAVGLSIMISYIKHRSGLSLTSFFDRGERLIFLLITTILLSNQATINFIIYNALCTLAIIQLMHKVRQRL